MEPPVTPKPIPASSAELPLDHTNKLFGIVYITLKGVIDTIAPAVSPWLWLGKSMSYLIKLALILWWALSTQSATRQFPNASELANQGWFPDTTPLLFGTPRTFLTSGEIIVKSLACENLDLRSTKLSFSIPSPETLPLSPPLVQDGANSVPLQEVGILPSVPSCAPWLFAGFVLMGLNSYFPQLSLVSSLWSPLRAVVPVIYWVVSLWFVPPGWKPNLVSLAPLSHTK
ncbi:hypothetical protein DSO57_1010533 [Entomophthora muscae]|uniref:Uncharacterized protein n=1 Tax=Entomophthora muscae TaxID=34485 RepID=A0ACC2U4B5_9FUNG|nr:hypothetical protein DSO57_1010533 [Entomophthora muscae]